MMKDGILAVVRHALGALGGYLVGTGMVDQAGATELAGAISTLIAMGWSLYEKRKRTA